MLLEFYAAQDVQITYPYLSAIVAVCMPACHYCQALTTYQVQPPTTSLSRSRLYTHVSQFLAAKNASEPATTLNALERTPNSSHGELTPVKSPMHGKSSGPTGESRRLDLS